MRVESTRYRFGIFELDLSRDELRRAGSRVKLRGRPLEILAALLERPGEIVTREALRDRLWPADTFVDFDHGLNSSVNRLREALGDAADNPRFVETIPRRGYRFIAPVERDTRVPDATREESLPDPVAAATPRLARGVLGAGMALLAAAVALGAWWLVRGRKGDTDGAGPAPLRLAVLPFDDLSEDGARSFLADGMTDALITDLSQVKSLRVISRTTALAYKDASKSLTDIARELRVDAAVEGSVVHTGDRARINAQLIDTAHDRTLWARSYDCSLADVLDVQRRVAREIAESVRVAISEPERSMLERTSPISPDAFEAYVRGRLLREQLTREGLTECRDAFTRVVGLAPEFAPGWAALADVYWVMGAPGYDSTDPRETMPLARTAARRALEIDPREPLALATLGNVAIDYDWNRVEAETWLKRALEVSPSFAGAHLWYSGLLTAMGRHDEAIAESQRARELDPLSRRAAQTLGIRYYYAGRDGEAEAVLRRVLETDPDAFAGRAILGLVYLRRGDTARALSELERAVEDSGSNAWVLSLLGYAYGVAGRRADAGAVLGKLRDAGRVGRLSPFTLAAVWLGLGDRDAALAALEKAYDERSGWMTFLEAEPTLDGLRGDPRFKDLLERVGHRSASASPPSQAVAE